MQQFLIPLAAVLAVPALAQSTTAPPASVPTSQLQGLPRLVNELPLCAIKCFTEGAKGVNCPLTDLSCLCRTNNAAAFATSVTTCMRNNPVPPRPSGSPDIDDDTDPNECQLDELDDIVELAGRICLAALANPPQSQLAQATSVINDKITRASATSGGGNGATPTGSSNNNNNNNNNNNSGRSGAGRLEMAQGMLVAAVGYALIAL